MTDRDLIGEKVISQHYGEGEITNTQLNGPVKDRKVEIQFRNYKNWFGIFAFRLSLQASNMAVHEYIVSKIDACYTVSFDCNPIEYFINGVAVSGPQNVKGGDKVTLPLPPARDEYKFVGWKQGDKVYFPGTIYTIETDTIFIALWEKPSDIHLPIPHPHPLIPPPYDTYTRTTPGYKYDEVEKKYGISIRYFGRGINPTPNCIVLISRIKETADYYVYHDHWVKDGEYIFSGEGLSGDQKLTRGNLAIVNAKKNKKPIYLFLKFSSTDYLYQGEFELVDYYQEKEPGEDKELRMEYKFHLRKVEGT